MTRLATLTMLVALGVSFPVGAARGSTFRDAEFLPLDRGIEAAQAFVSAALPPGLPGTEARTRLRRADMRCGKPRRDGAVACDFAEVVHIEGGVLGEHHWTVTLRFDSMARIASATLDQFVVGVGNPGL